MTFDAPRAALGGASQALESRDDRRQILPGCYLQQQYARIILATRIEEFVHDSKTRHLHRLRR
jgi:hypothetical protein